VFGDFGLGLRNLFDDAGADAGVSVAALQGAAAVGTAFEAMVFPPVDANRRGTVHAYMPFFLSRFFSGFLGRGFLIRRNHPRRSGRSDGGSGKGFIFPQASGLFQNEKDDEFGIFALKIADFGFCKRLTASQ